jgi:hypothetical protein
VTTQRELERRARRVYGSDAFVNIKLIATSDDGQDLWEVRLFSSRYTDAVRRTGADSLKARAEACEAFGRKLAALEAGGWNWRKA